MRLAILSLISSGVFLFAQVNTGSISGFVLDPSGKAVPRAAVTIRNPARAADRSAYSDATGHYEFAGLSPAQYEVSVNAAGFAVATSQPVRVEVDQRERLDMPLRISARGEVVVISGGEYLKTESSELGGVLDQSRVEALPLNQRDFLQLAFLLPGVAPPVTGSQLSTRGTFAMHANGGREEFNNYLLDGVDNNDPDSSGYVLQPSVDTIREFKIATNSYSAEYGKGAAGQVNVITRSGTNQFHGSAYDYLRNRVLDARNFFDGPNKPEFIRNQFGAGVGGPISKDRTFFYTNYEGLQERQSLTQLGTVPTASVRAGDLSSLAGVIVKDPFNGVAFPGNKIPVSRISPYSANVLALFPTPNLPGASGNFLGSPTGSFAQNEGSVRVDHRISDTQELNVRYSVGRQSLFEPFAENQTELPGFGDNVFNQGHNALIHYQRTLSPRAINSVLIGFNRSIRQVLTQNHTLDVDKLWGVNYLPTVPRDFGYPGISVTGYSRVGDVAALPIDRATNTYQLGDNFTFIRGAQSIKIGGEARALQLNGYVEVFSRGQINFTGALSGSGIGDLLLGLPTLGIKSQYTGPQTLRSHSWSGYVQDDWKLTRTLTLNLGLRYEYDTPATDPTNRMATFDFAKGQTVQVGTSGFSRSGTQPHKDDFEPRVGFAWAPIEHTVIRGGYGIYHDAGMFVVNSSLYYNPPFFTISVYFPSQTSLITLANPFAASNGFVPPAALSIISPDFAPAYLQDWNLDIQREVAGVGTFSLAYAASKGTHLPRSLDINQPLPGPAPLSSRAPYPALSNILETESGGNSEYESLQFSYDRRLSHGLSVLAAYTFSKSIDDTSAFLPTGADQNFPQNSHNYRQERALSSFDMPQRGTVSFVYQIPGRNRWTRNFETSSIVAAQSGQPFSPQLSSDNSNTGNTGGNFGIDRPNVLRSPSIPNPSPTRWFDTSAFVIPPPYTFGNAGRNILRGPGLFTVDLSLRRSFPISEHARLIADVQGFNLLNRANFNLPNAFADQPLTFGRIFSAKQPRQIQIAMRLEF